MAQIQDLESAYLLGMTEDRLYAAINANVYDDPTATLLIYDLKHRQNPTLLSSVSLARRPSTFVAHKGTAVLGNRYALVFIDVSDAKAPRRLGGNSAVTVFDLLIRDDTLYVRGSNQISSWRLPGVPTLRLPLPTLSGNGVISVNGSTPPPGLQLLRSYDLTNWTIWKTVAPSEPINFSDSTDAPRAFYRGHVP